MGRRWKQSNHGESSNQSNHVERKHVRNFGSFLSEILCSLNSLWPHTFTGGGEGTKNYEMSFHWIINRNLKNWVSLSVDVVRTVIRGRKVRVGVGGWEWTASKGIRLQNILDLKRSPANQARYYQLLFCDFNVTEF